MAESANETAQKAEARQTERNDVAWEWSWTGHGKLTFSNSGMDKALDTHLVVTVEDERREISADEVGDPITIDFKAVADAHAAALQREAREEAQWDQPSPHWGVPTPNIIHTPESILWGVYRITWRSALGQHRSEEQRMMFNANDVLGRQP